MNDRSVQVNLGVNVTGEEHVKSAATSLNQFGQAVDSLRGKTAAGVGGVGGLMQQVGAAFKGGVSGIGSLFRQIGGDLRQALSPIGAGIATFARTTVSSVLQQTGAIGSRVAGVLAAALGPLALGAGLAAVAVAGLAKSTFQLAKETAASTLETAARARRMRTDFATAEREGMLAAGLIGDNFAQLEAQITKRFTARRMEKGLLGDKSIFARWGITPRAIRRTEQQLGRRMGVADWLQRFVAKREELEAQLAKATTPRARQRIERRLDQLADDTTKLFGAQFAERVQRWSLQNTKDYRRAMARAAAVGLPEDAMKRLREDAAALTIAQEEYRRTMQQLAQRQAAPSIKPIADVYQELARLQQTFGPAIADFKGALSGKVWEGIAGTLRGLREALGTDTPGIIEGWTKAIRGFNAEARGAAIGKILAQIASPARAWEAFQSDLEKTGQELGDIGSVLWDALKSIPDVVLRGLKSEWEQVKTRFKELAAELGIDVSDIWEGLADGLERAWQGVRAGWEAAKASFTQLGRDLPGVDDIGATIRGWLQQLWDNIKSAWEGAKAWFKGLGGKLFGAGPQAGDAGEAPTAPAAAPAVPVRTDLGVTLQAGLEKGATAGAETMQTAISKGADLVGPAMEAGANSISAAASNVSAQISAAAGQIAATAAGWGASAAAALRAGIAGISIPVTGMSATGATSRAAPASTGGDNP